MPSIRINQKPKQYVDVPANNKLDFKIKRINDTFHCCMCKYKTVSGDEMQKHLELHVMLEMYHPG